MDLKDESAVRVAEAALAGQLTAKEEDGVDISSSSSLSGSDSDMEDAAGAMDDSSSQPELLVSSGSNPRGTLTEHGSIGVDAAAGSSRLSSARNKRKKNASGITEL